jgi:hypothetical protein
MPGVIQRLVCVQEEKKPVSPTSLCSISMANPIIRPTSAPTEGGGTALEDCVIDFRFERAPAREGMNMPAGRRVPYTMHMSISW